MPSVTPALDRCRALSTQPLVVSALLICALAAEISSAETLRRGTARIDFPAPAEHAEIKDETDHGVMTRFAAIAVTPDCDYALFEYRYPRDYVEFIGVEALLASAVQASVAQHNARVEALERDSLNGNPTVDMDFSINARKGAGAARYVRSGAVVIEASVLCTPDATGDPSFLRSLTVE